MRQNKHQRIVYEPKKHLIKSVILESHVNSEDRRVSSHKLNLRQVQIKTVSQKREKKPRVIFKIKNGIPHTSNFKMEKLKHTMINKE